MKDVHLALDVVVHHQLFAGEIFVKMQDVEHVAVRDTASSPCRPDDWGRGCPRRLAERTALAWGLERERTRDEQTRTEAEKRVGGARAYLIVCREKVNNYAQGESSTRGGSCGILPA